MIITTTILASLITDETTAQAIADALSEMFDPEDLAASAFEIASLEAVAANRPIMVGKEGAMGTLLPAEGEPWRAEIHFAEAPDEDEIRAIIAEIAGEDAAKAVVFSEIAAQDWVATSLEGLDPVAAGRFVVHGAHDRDKVKPNQIGIEIEAALAFGTGHHGTTRGCLLHLDAMLKRLSLKKNMQIVDIGSGTGVLAFAAAKALKMRVEAGEIDPDSVEIAWSNARLNKVGAFVRPVVAAGLQHPILRGTRRYDLVFANILARPLRKLAPEIARATAWDGELILSGLLYRDVPGVLAAYGAHGFRLVSRRNLDGWASLILKRGGAAERPYL